ncbi:iron-sulfur cluster assembly accessory protein [Melioribacter roseus P3M-2]|uniref:Iron-sulfur cluster assembly accessory protein n=2 Tax=Melioribacteraceae TaxID=1334117 RepID=I6Z8W7_MELRP|nr:iron-sulfur cluster assembly accessory protein [Melioribacter roseus P3M-2]
MTTETNIKSEIDITEKAINEVNRLKKENNIPDTHGLRVGVKGGGCSGLTYQLGFDAEPKEGDAVIEKGGLKLYIDGKSLFYLSGTVLDFSDGLNGRGFVFNNPNAKKTCGCGESFGV